MISVSAIKARYRVAEDPLKTQRRVELAVIVLALLFALQLLWGVTRLLFLPPPAPVTPAADTLRVLPMSSLAAVSIDDSNEIRSRPVFWLSRRPLADVETLVEQQSTTKGKATPRELKQINLLGVFGSEEATGIIAMVKGKKRRLMEGEEYSGWTLSSVEANKVTFTDGPRSETLTLKKAVIEAPPAAATAPADGKKTAAESASDKQPTTGPAGADTVEEKEPAPPRGLSLGGT